MAYQNFIPAVWNEGINRELERLCVFVEDCNRQYEGSVKKKGESVTILGVGKPTIKSLAKANRNNDIDAPEEIEDTSVIMYINQIRYFNYMVGDIDKAQAVNGVMDALEQETSEGLADEVDKYVASFAVDSSVAKLNDSAALVTKDNILSTLDLAIQKLYENDVKATTKIVVTISPRFYTLFKQAYIDKDTDNSEMLKNGRVAKYGNVIVKMSNNVHKTDSGATDNIMIRTQRAIAFAKPLTHTEPYRPEKKFADAVKGFILFDAKVVRPKEVININVKYA
nr:MAG TPA: Major capsid protein [Caudoviricetes sp.]